MAGCAIVPLTGIVLDGRTAIRRDFTCAPEHRDAEYLAHFDATTLLYDAVWSAGTREVVLTAPLFLNLWAPFRAGLRLDGAPVPRLRRLTGRGSEQVVIRVAPGARRPACVSVGIGGAEYALAIRDGLAEGFRGRNTLLAMNRDNPLEWIRDWARFHVGRHGAEAVVIADNGSLTYGAAELADCLAAVPGLKAVAVIGAPFLYGLSRRIRSRGEKSAKFLQRAMLNLVRADACRGARAVLSIDIDELVAGPEGARVFDAAVAHGLGMVTVNGRWAYPGRDDPLPAPHAAHRFRRADGRDKCNRKWCIAPGGVIGRHFLWDVHRVGGALQNAFTERNRFELVHCWGTTTGWKRKDRDPALAFVRDPQLDALMDRYLPATAS